MQDISQKNARDVCMRETIGQRGVGRGRFRDHIRTSRYNHCLAANCVDKGRDHVKLIWTWFYRGPVACILISVLR